MAVSAPAGEDGTTGRGPAGVGGSAGHGAAGPGGAGGPGAAGAGGAGGHGAAGAGGAGGHGAAGSGETTGPDPAGAGGAGGPGTAGRDASVPGMTGGDEAAGPGTAGRIPGKTGAAGPAGAASPSPTVGPRTATHRHGRLALVLERRGPRTIVAEQDIVFPSGTVRIADVDGDGVGELQITNPSGGLLAGDRLDTVLEARAGTRSSVVTQGANRVCGVARGLVPVTTTLDTRLRLEDDARLEWAPHHLVPYARSAIRQRTTVEVAPEAGLLLWETLSAGRSGRGERFAWERLDTRLRVMRDGRPLLQDGAVLGPGGEPFDGADLVATVVVVVPRGAETRGAGTGGAATGGAVTGGAETGGAETGGAETGGAVTGGAEDGAQVDAGRLADGLHGALAAVRGTLASASAVAEDVVVARVVARDAIALYRALDAIRGLGRPAIGLPAPQRPVV